jgi:predicted nucleic acid-binding protein
MIADTTFVSDLLKEFRSGKSGPARRFFADRRREVIRTTIITAGELAVMFDSSWEAWAWLRKWRIYPLHNGIAQAAADIDRTLAGTGNRLAGCRRGPRPKGVPEYAPLLVSLNTSAATSRRAGSRGQAARAPIWTDCWVQNSIRPQ